MGEKRLYDTLQLLKVDLYNIQGLIKELVDAALPYLNDTEKSYNRLDKAIQNAKFLLGERTDLK